MMRRPVRRASPVDDAHVSWETASVKSTLSSIRSKLSPFHFRSKKTVRLDTGDVYSLCSETSSQDERDTTVETRSDCLFEDDPYNPPQIKRNMGPFSKLRKNIRANCGRNKSKSSKRKHSSTEDSASLLSGKSSPHMSSSSSFISDHTENIVPLQDLSVYQLKISHDRAIQYARFRTAHEASVSSRDSSCLEDVEVIIEDCFRAPNHRGQQRTTVNSDWRIKTPSPIVHPTCSNTEALFDWRDQEVPSVNTTGRPEIPHDQQQDSTRDPSHDRKDSSNAHVFPFEQMLFVSPEWSNVAGEDLFPDDTAIWGGADDVPSFVNIQKFPTVKPDLSFMTTENDELHDPDADAHLFTPGSKSRNSGISDMSDDDETVRTGRFGGVRISIQRQRSNGSLEGKSSFRGVHSVSSSQRPPRPEAQQKNRTFSFESFQSGDWSTSFKSKVSETLRRSFSTMSASPDRSSVNQDENSPSTHPNLEKSHSTNGAWNNLADYLSCGATVDL